eukprot:SM000026S08987  [mRNA]  locus=s26:820858:826280:- [translate_table: standard]
MPSQPVLEKSQCYGLMTQMSLGRQHQLHVAAGNMAAATRVKLERLQRPFTKVQGLCALPAQAMRTSMGQLVKVVNFSVRGCLHAINMAGRSMALAATLTTSTDCKASVTIVLLGDVKTGGAAQLYTGGPAGWGNGFWKRNGWPSKRRTVGGLGAPQNPPRHEARPWLAAAWLAALPLAPTLAASAALAVAVAACLLFWWWPKRPRVARRASAGGAGALSGRRAAGARVAPSSGSEAQLAAAGAGELTKFAYYDLQTGTEGFSRKTHLLGTWMYGRVYRCHLPDDQVVALTRLEPINLSAALWPVDKSFFSTMQRLASLRHPKILRLKGYCIHDQERLLVHELCIGGSLEHLLHPRAGTEGLLLGWIGRLRVALDVAEAIDVLHRSMPPLVHADIRPENVFINDDNRAKLRGYSYQLLLKRGIYQAWSPSRLAPELRGSNLQEASPATDVYSYGLLLLELLTGRTLEDIGNPPEKMKEAPSAHFPFLSDHCQLLQMVDAQLQKEMAPHEFSTVAHLAALCVRDNPEHRIDMSHIVATMHSLQVN